MANQVARQTDNFDDFRVGFSRRLGAFAETHDLLVVDDWARRRPPPAPYKFRPHAAIEAPRIAPPQGRDSCHYRR